jgi:hypothetical protein
MEQQEKKINLAFDINKELQRQISDSSMVKYAVYSFAAIGGILTIGFLAKILNYTITNITTLKNTIKS